MARTIKGQGATASPEATANVEAAAPAPAPAANGSDKLGDANNPPKGEEIDGGDVEEVIKLDAGESITVVYKGFKETKGQKVGQVNRLHKIVMEDGVPRGIWGTVTLDAMLAKINTGDHIWIAYLGKDDIPGGKTMHNWKIVRTKRA
jgi:hypothetical protein